MPDTHFATLDDALLRTRSLTDDVMMLITARAAAPTNPAVVTALDHLRTLAALVDEGPKLRADHLGRTRYHIACPEDLTGITDDCLHDGLTKRLLGLYDMAMRALTRTEKRRPDFEDAENFVLAYLVLACTFTAEFVAREERLPQTVFDRAREQHNIKPDF
jgi:hypothetical protein